MPKKKAQAEEPEGQDNQDWLPEPDFGMIGAAGGAEETPDETPEGEAPAEAPEGQEEPDAGGQDEVRRELDELRQQLAQRDQRIDALMQGILTNGNQSQAQPSHQPPAQPNFDNMPDPVDKPAEFRQWMAQTVQQARQAQTPQTDPVEQTWTQFLDREDNADLKQNKMVAEAVAREEANAMRQRGIDPVRAVQVDPEGVLSRVAQRTREYLGQLSGGQPETKAQPKANRTAGVTAGSSRGVARQPKNDQPSDFLAEIKQVQGQYNIL